MTQSTVTIPRGGPTLGTVRMVEETLRTAPESLTTLAELKRLLPRKVNHNALLEILDYLQDHNRILIGAKGIMYTHNPSPKLDAAIRNGYRVVFTDGRPEFSRVNPKISQISRHNS